jgi:hypothetical protein
MQRTAINPRSWTIVGIRPATARDQALPRINERFGNGGYATSVLGVAQLSAQFLVMLVATAVD